MKETFQNGKRSDVFFENMPELVVSHMLKFIFKLLISVLFVYFLTSIVSWKSIFLTIRTANHGYYAISFVPFLCTIFTLVAKCAIIIDGSTIRHSFLNLTKINIISRFYGLFLPPAIGPEMIRWYKITQNQSGKIFFLAASLFERVGFVLISLIAGALFLYLSPNSENIRQLQKNLLPPLLILIFFSACLHLFFLSRRFHSYGERIISKVLPNRLRIKDRLIEIYDKLCLPNRSAKLFWGITLLSISWHVLFLCRNYFLFKALSIPMGFGDIAWITSLVFLLQLLPVSFAGIGVREGALAFMFTQLGLPADQGVAVGVLFFSQVLIVAGMGAFLELCDCVKGK